MTPYQEEYIDNTRKIASLLRSRGPVGQGFGPWYEEQEKAFALVSELRQANLRLLNEQLFPELDRLHGASDETLDDLIAFADQLMDWKDNLDCGVYVTIHDALLSLYRMRRDRNRVIQELYKLGMGLYYLRRILLGLEGPQADPFYFRNELTFAEAASYIRYFDRIDDETTKGYIIRSFANIALCCRSHKRRIDATARTLKILKDESYRAQAPGLPWDAFLRGSHQQMSANRTELSRGDLTAGELAAVLDSCYEVFKPETGSANPSIRWLWPYYEMEYNCGYVGLALTADRMEELIRMAKPDQYDVSGFYGNVQLPMYYGRLMKKTPALGREPKRASFYAWAVEKMLLAVFSCPAEKYDDYFYYNVAIVASDYYETENVPPFREVALRLMRRMNKFLYIRSRRMGKMMRCFCEAIYRREPAFFDDIPFLKAMQPGEGKEKALLDYAEGCGLFCDFGLLKMNITRQRFTRSLFEREDEMVRLHTAGGWEDLRAKASTETFADIALGHHSWYNGSNADGSGYIRGRSPYRQMTDVAAVVAYLAENADLPDDALIGGVFAGERRRFSPPVTAYLREDALRADLLSVLRGDDREYYLEIYEELIS